ncbi:MAG TPA: hypothetical protein VGV87_00760 [Blastocatellia bacterium]|jgi:hypothetical protein|nr:hypothetical protein [Blastocatellia bacterium]
MADDEINYVKEVFKSDLNLGFVGVMAFLILVVNFWGFLALLAAGEVGALFIAQDPRVQRIIRARKNKDQKLETEDSEKTIVVALPQAYQNDFFSVRNLCDEIEKRSAELDDKGSNAILSGVTEKLSAFRFEYARMLRAHHLLSSRNYRNLQNMLNNEIIRAEKSVHNEQSEQVRQALSQNLNILKKRQARIQKLDELVRLLEARLQVVRNSLSLIQDEVYSFTNVAGISDLVDNLLTNLSISDEFRSTYEDVLITETDSLSSLEASPVEHEPPQIEEPPAEEDDSARRRASREHIRRVK